MEIRALKLPGTYAIQPQPRHDHRGYFMRVYDETLFCEHDLETRWVQENQSLSVRRHTVRGLHFQKPPHAETKLVRVVAGAILDVFVDLRKDSPDYGCWDAVELSAENQRMVFIPKGFAHGFCSLSEKALVLYKVDTFYAPEFEGGLRWDDETLNIHWPTDDPHMSAKDRELGRFRDFQSPF